ncbi:MAG: hypothetical protein GXO94_01960 [Nitrospirae bacterium]|nr:hypothetical protein [Nitrospirota bacterium]
MDVLRKYVLGGMLCLLLLGAGCRSSMPSFHIRQDVDFGFIKKVAVLPLNNLTNERYAADAVREVVISELLASGLVDVVVPGDVTAAMDSLGIRSVSSLNAEQIKALGKALGVQAVIFGSVEEFGMVRLGNISAPNVTITLMMADTGSGSIIWSVTTTGTGGGFMARHFGARSETMSETLLRVVRDAIRTLTEYGS